MLLLLLLLLLLVPRLLKAAGLIPMLPVRVIAVGTAAAVVPAGQQVKAAA